MSETGVLKNTVFASLGTYIEFFLGLIISIAIARTLGPEHYGSYSLLVWIGATITVIGNGGLQTGVTKFLAEARGKGEGLAEPITDYLCRTQQLRLAFVLVVAAIAVAVAGHLVIPVHTELLWLILVAAGFKATYMFYVSVAKGAEDFRAIAKAVLFVAPINVAMVMVAAYLELGVEGYVMVFCLASILYYGVMRAILRKYIRWHTKRVRLSREYLRRIHHHLRIAAINILLAYVIFRQSELFFLDVYASRTDVAMYNVAFMLASAAAALVPGVYSAVLLPLMAKNINKGRDEIAKRFSTSLRHMAMLSTPLVVGGAVFANDFIVFLYGAEYQGAVFPFIACLFVATMQMVAHAATSYQVSADRQTMILKFLLIGCALSLAFDYILIKEYGIYGAVFANATGGLFVPLSMLILTKRELAVQFAYSKYLKYLLSALLAAAPFVAIGEGVSSVAFLGLGVPAFSAIYFTLLLLTKALDHDEILIIRRIRQRLFGDHYLVLDRVLVWLQNR